MVCANYHFIIHKVANKVNKSHSSCQPTLINDFGMCKVLAKTVLQLLSDDQKQQCMILFLISVLMSHHFLSSTIIGNKS